MLEKEQKDLLVLLAYRDCKMKRYKSPFVEKSIQLCRSQEEEEEDSDENEDKD